MEDQEVSFSSFTALTDNAFTREGYRFTGWSIQGEPGYHVMVQYMLDHYHISVDTSFPSVTLVANWEQYHTVTFIPNGGEFEEQFNTTQTVTHGQKLTGVPSISKEDFNFYGWVLEDNSIVDFANTNIEHDYVVNARWVFTVHYHQWDGEAWVENETLLNEEAQNPIALPEIEATIHENVSWNTQDNGEGTSFTTDEMQELPHPDGAIDLYEIHVPKSFVVHFDSNGSDDEFEDNVFHYGDDILLDVGEPYLEGYTFLGWYDLRNPERPEGPYRNESDLSEKFGYYELTLVAQYEEE